MFLKVAKPVGQSVRKSSFQVGFNGRPESFTKYIYALCSLIFYRIQYGSLIVMCAYVVELHRSPPGDILKCMVRVYSMTFYLWETNCVVYEYISCTVFRLHIIFTEVVKQLPEGSGDLLSGTMQWTMVPQRHLHVMQLRGANCYMREESKFKTPTHANVALQLYYSHSTSFQHIPLLYTVRFSWLKYISRAWNI